MKCRLFVAGVLALSSFYLGGCALTTDKIAINYLPQTKVTSVEGSKSVVVDVKVNDSRIDKERVSSKKNGFGMEMAKIVAAEEVNLTFKKAMEYELQARGFILGRNALVSVDADLTKFYNDFKLGFFAGDAIAELNLGVMVKNKKGDILFSRQFISQGKESNIQLMTGDNARLALEKALSEGMIKVFADQKFLTAIVTASRN